jgi:hypothetical protein
MFSVIFIRSNQPVFFLQNSLQRLGSFSSRVTLNMGNFKRELNFHNGADARKVVEPAVLLSSSIKTSLIQLVKSWGWYQKPILSSSKVVQCLEMVKILLVQDTVWAPQIL